MWPVIRSDCRVPTKLAGMSSGTKSLLALFAAAVLLAPLALRAAPAEQDAATQMVTTLERLSDAWTNRGRMNAVLDRAQELGLAQHTRTEWIDWFTLYSNVVVEIPGESDEIVYLVAHYDKVDTTPIAIASLFLNGMLDELVSWTYLTDGALDNGTGVALVLSLARHLSTRKNHFTYRFLLTGSEEMGLRGARAHMARLSQEEVGRIAYVLNLDTLARAQSRDCALIDIGDPLLTARLLYAARDTGSPIGESVIPEGASSDHAPFSRTGFWHDFGRGIMFNLPGGFLPQRSWFTSGKETRVVMLSDCSLVGWREYLAGLVFLPIGIIHGPRDSLSKVDGAALAQAFNVVRVFVERVDADPS